MMRHNFKLSVVLVGVVAFLPRAYGQNDPVNQVEVQVGRTTDINEATITVTICEPGTQKCQTIENVQVDTGSTGLRIFQPLTLNLPTQRLHNSGDLFTCEVFADKSAYWGPVQKADVKIGGEMAPNIQIQVMSDKKLETSNCASVSGAPIANSGLVGKAKRKSNGILGIRLNRTDCGDRLNNKYCLQASDGFYSVCTEQACEKVTIPSRLALKNPVSSFRQDNNGYILTFDEVEQDSQNAKGYLTFGINTQANNRFTLPAGHKLPLGTGAMAWVFNTNSDGNVMSYDAYRAMLDTGSWSSQIPSSFLPGLSDAQLHAKLIQFNGSDDLLATLPFALKLNLISKNYNLAPVKPFAAERSSLGGLILGLPFFFGKTVYFGFGAPNKPHDYGYYAF